MIINIKRGVNRMFTKTQDGAHGVIEAKIGRVWGLRVCVCLSMHGHFKATRH